MYVCLPVQEWSVDVENTVSVSVSVSVGTTQVPSALRNLVSSEDVDVGTKPAVVPEKLEYVVSLSVGVAQLNVPSPSDLKNSEVVPSPVTNYSSAPTILSVISADVNGTGVGVFPM